MVDLIKGIDVSSVQGNIDWNSVVSTGVQFAVIKCGNGNDGFDPFYSRNVTNATAAGIHVATYHFVYPLPDSPGHINRNPSDQARYHFNQCHTDVVAIDLEWPATQDWAKWGVDANFIAGWCIEYLETYTSLAGKMPLVYTYPYWATAVNFPAQIAQFQLWAASYEATPRIPAPWTDWVLWQNSGGTQHLPNGVPVDTDLAKDLSLWGV